MGPRRPTFAVTAAALSDRGHLPLHERDTRDAAGVAPFLTSSGPGRWLDMVSGLLPLPATLRHRRHAVQTTGVVIASRLLRVETWPARTS